MKTKLFAYALIIFVYLVPFRIAVITPTNSNTINLLCMIASVVGTLTFIALTISDGNRPLEQTISKAQTSESNYKKAA